MDKLRLGNKAEENQQEHLPSALSLEGESEVAQSCPTLCDPVDSSQPGSSIHGVFQARLLEWGAIAFSKLGGRN